MTRAPNRGNDEVNQMPGGDLFKGFRDFVLRGNIVDLAVAVVIGTAFAALVKQFSDSFIEPLISVVTGGGEPTSTFTIRGVEFGYGAFIGEVFTFTITAAIVYFLVVVPMNNLLNRFKKPAEEELAQPSEVDLLTEIRDLLASRDARL